MAVDMFLKIEGEDIKGEAVDAAHKDEIDVLAWSWGATQSGSMHTSKGGGSGKVNVQDISITKWVDSATSPIFKSVCNGESFKKCTLTVRKAGKSPLEYLVITMEKCIISSVSTGGSGGEDRLTENISINFAKFKVAYTPQKEDGSGDAAKEVTWNIAENTE
jgi:type VI secretion system secreted protein Hcp